MDFNNLGKMQLNVISLSTTKEKAMWLMARSLPCPTVCSLLDQGGDVHLRLTSLICDFDLNHFSAWLHFGHLPFHLQEFTGALREEDTDQCGCWVWSFCAAKLNVLYRKRRERGSHNIRCVSYLLLPVVRGPLNMTLLYTQVVRATVVQ